MSKAHEQLIAEIVRVTQDYPQVDWKDEFRKVLKARNVRCFEDHTWSDADFAAIDIGKPDGPGNYIPITEDPRITHYTQAGPEAREAARRLYDAGRK